MPWLVDGDLPHLAQGRNTSPLARLRELTGLGAALLLAAGPAARADVVPGGLNTTVSQTCNPGGSCAVAIDGGTPAGKNLFHRFAAFDTTVNTGGDGSPISNVLFRNGGASNVIVGALTRTVISVPVGLQTKGNLIWLSPAGISLQSGGSFFNVANLTLSTATSLRLKPLTPGDPPSFQVFDAVTTPATSDTFTGAIGADTLDGDPVTGRAGLFTNPDSLIPLELPTNGEIALSDGLLTIDQSLLVDAQAGDVLVIGTSIGAGTSSTASPGGDLELAGAGVALGPGANGASGIDLSGSTGALTITGDSSGVVIDGGALKTGSGPIAISGSSKLGGGSANGLELTGVSVSSSSGSISLSGSGGQADGGPANGLMLSNSQLSSIDGAITLNGTAGLDGFFNADAIGIAITGSQIQSSGGAIQATGQGGLAAGGSSSGILVTSSPITSGTGDLRLTGTAGTSPSLIGGGGNDSIPSAGADTFNAGIDILSSTLSTAATGADQGNLTLSGTGGIADGGPTNGLQLTDATLTTLAGNQSLTGTGGSSTLRASGIELRSSSLSSGRDAGFNQSAINGGSISLNGSGGSGGSDAIGLLASSSQITNRGSGRIDLTGSGGSQGLTSAGSVRGIALDNGSSVNSGSGAITLNGSGGDAFIGQADGLFLGSTLISTTGPITLNGAGGSVGTSSVSPLIAAGALSEGGAVVGGPGTAQVQITSSQGDLTLNGFFQAAGPINVQSAGSLQQNATLESSGSLLLQARDSLLLGGQLVSSGGPLNVTVIADQRGSGTPSLTVADPTFNLAGGVASLYDVSATEANLADLDLSDRILTILGGSTVRAGTLTIEGGTGTAVIAPGGSLQATDLTVREGSLAILSTAPRATAAFEGGSIAALFAGDPGAINPGSPGLVSISNQFDLIDSSLEGDGDLTTSDFRFGGLSTLASSGVFTTTGNGSVLDPGGTTTLRLRNNTTWTNRGTLALTSSAPLLLDFGDTGSQTNRLRNTSGGVISSAGPDVSVQGTDGVFTNAGSLRVSGGTLAVLLPTVAQSGVLDVAAGSTLLRRDGSSSAEKGTLINAEGGQIQGNGLIDLGPTGQLSNRGRIAPGGQGSPGTLSVLGSLILEAPSQVEIELGGNTPGSQYDVLAVSGTVTLGGRFSATLSEGFRPASGQTFDVITAANGLSGSFQATALPSKVSGKTLSNRYQLVVGEAPPSPSPSRPINPETLLVVEQVLSQTPLNNQPTTPPGTTTLVNLKISDPLNPGNTVLVVVDLDQSIVFLSSDTGVVGFDLNGLQTTPLSPNQIQTLYQNGEQQSQQSTAEAIGLDPRDLSEVPSTEQLKLLLKAVANWMRSQYGQLR